MSFAIRTASASSSNGITAATGPEDLLARDAVLVRRLDQRRGVPVAGAVRHVAAKEDVAVDERRHGLAVLRGDQRPHLRGLVGGVADLDAARRVDE